MNKMPLNILIVDDIADNRTILSRPLERRGFNVTQAENGYAALELIAARSFDLVLLDIVMPEMDGLEVLRRIRASFSPAALPVIMVTAKTDASDVVEALKLGANDYLTKPISLAVALARVQVQIARKQAEEALQQANEDLARNVRDLVEANKRLELEIAERERSEARIRYLSHHDALTGLANRSRFHQQAQRVLSRAGNPPGSLALICLGLDNFKAFNDALGPAAGDNVLRSVAERLRGCVRDEDTVARLGGDEFGIVLGSVQRPEDASALAQRIVEAIAAPHDVDGQELIISCSVGIALTPNDGDDPDQLLTCADLALQRAKAEGGGISRFFEPEMNVRAQIRRRLELDLRKALGAGEFEVFYQPLFNLDLGAIVGCEALLRWRHPERGMVSPGEFIPLAEELGLIVPIGEWVLRQACEDAAQWPGDIKVAVNLSPLQFRNGTLLRSVVLALAASGLSPDRLELEITESVILNDDEKTLSVLHQLRGLGVRISMDDFGTGYSSLSYLRSFPFDKIKIDQSFIRDLSERQDGIAIVRAIASLAANLGMKTTAEGVETEQQLELIRAQGCTEVQGYFIGRPVPAKEIRSLLSASSSVERRAA